MSIEVKQAAQQAVDAFDAFGDADDFASLFELTQKMRALRTAIQQAEAQRPATGEPVYQIRKAFSQDAEWAWRDATEALFHMHPKEHRRILYTHPAPGVPDDVVRDAERYRWLRKSLPAGQGSLTVLLDDRRNGCFNKPLFMGQLDAAIDAAMLAAPQAQKVKV